MDSPNLICYVAVARGNRTYDYAARFVGSFLANPPGAEYRLIVACNGGPLPTETALLFSPIAANFFIRENDPGWDISAFIDVANQFKSERQVCFGESVFFHRSGWLLRMVEAWNLYGPGMYGFWSSNLLRPHLNTTGFVCPPALLAKEPWPKNRKERYEFEHGKNAFWRRLYNARVPVKLVTFNGAWDPPVWRMPKDCLWKGTQENSLAFCIHTDRWANAKPPEKKFWSEVANSPYL